MRFQRAMRWFGKASGAIGASAAVFGLLVSGLAAAAPEDGSVQTASAPPPAQAPQPQSLSEGVGAETFREQLRAEISWRGWIRGRYGSRVRIGEDQIKAYQARLVAETSKPHYQISEVFIDTARAGGPQAAINGANQLIAELQKGAPFAAVARQFSSSPTSANGGLFGWIVAGA